MCLRTDTQTSRHHADDYIPEPFHWAIKSDTIIKNDDDEFRFNDASTHEVICVKMVN